MYIIMLYSQVFIIVIEIKVVNTLSNRISQVNIQRRFMVDDNEWPPVQLKSFTPLLLIHYQGHCSSKEVTAMA